MGNIVGITCFQITGIAFDNKSVSSSCLRRACSVRNSFRSLQKEWEELKCERDDVLTKIDREEREHRRRLRTVVHWLSQVESIQNDFDQLQTDYSGQSANKCSANFFKTSYTFGRNVARVRKDVDSASKSKLVEVTQHVAIMPPEDIRVDQPIIGMHSMVDEVWSYMEADEFGIIGLYGMGGVGKTTLMKGLHNKTTQIFDVVFWIVISSAPSLSKVQDDIGSVLGLQGNAWKEKSQDDKAKVIHIILKRKKYVLFIDDIWERIDLLNLGVPVPDQTNKSKIVLTTRSREVCGQMEVDKTIQVTCLKEEAAWELFQKKAGEKTINDDPEIRAIAKCVAKECAGLPLALIAIGRAMACKTTLRAWNTALQKLKKYTSYEIQGMEDNVLRLLKFSYDSLSNASVKSCFLYCSLYPEDHLIDKDDIVDKWICEGFLGTIIDLHEARNEGHDYIDTLVNASLLEEINSEEIKMHDIIREMANWIGCECGEIKKFYVHAGGGLTETPNVAEFEGSERMSLMRNKIDKLSGKPNCPNMLTLFLNGNRLNHIDHEFFRSMQNLRVLDLSTNRNLKEIPEEVFNLVTLQYLNISYLKISMVPINLCKLINLKWLCIRTSRDDFLQLPEGVLSCLKKLQVVDFDDTHICLPENFVVEMESLEHLKDLRITIFNDFDLLGFSSSHKLSTIITLLRVEKISSTNLDVLLSQKMMKVESLDISSCKELEYVMSREINDLSTIIHGKYVMRILKNLIINNCRKLKDITVLTFAPNLEYINIQNSYWMKELCCELKYEEGARPTPFPKLKILHLANLMMLERIYPNALPLFPCLKLMHILGCPKLKKLPFNSGSGVTVHGEEEWWNGLEWEDEVTRVAIQFKPW